MLYLLLFLLLGVAFSLLGRWVALQKNREAAEGLALGFLFGPLGVLVEAMLPSIVRHPANPRRRKRHLVDRGLMSQSQLDEDTIAEYLKE